MRVLYLHCSNIVSPDYDSCVQKRLVHTIQYIATLSRLHSLSSPIIAAGRVTPSIRAAISITAHDLLMQPSHPAKHHILASIGGMDVPKDSTFRPPGTGDPRGRSPACPSAGAAHVRPRC